MNSLHYSIDIVVELPCFNSTQNHSSTSMPRRKMKNYDLCEIHSLIDSWIEIEL
jgi:hypothetical protein